MTRKWLPRLARFVGYGLLAVILADAALHIISRTQWFHARVRTALQQALGREIKLSNMGLNLRGIFVEGLEIAERGGFESGTFLEAGQLRMHVSFIHLLHGHAKVNQIALSNVTARVTAFADGTTSWDDFVAADAAADAGETSSGNSSFTLTADRIHLDNLRFIYVDHTASHTWDIDHISVGITHFNGEHSFPFYAQARLKPTVHAQTFDIPLVLRGTVDLKGMDLAKATLEVQALTISYNKATLTVKGNVENFENPQADLQLVLRHVSSEQFARFVSLPPFVLKEATAAVKLAADLEKSALTLHQVSVQAPGLDVRTQGGLLYGKQPLEYDVSAQGDFTLGEIGRWFTALAEPYRLVGSINTNVHATQQRIDGKITLQGIGGQVPQVGNISDVDATLEAQTAANFQSGRATANMTGKLNGRPFSLSVCATQTSEKIDMDLKAHAEEIRVHLPEAEHAEKSPQVPETAPQKPWPFAPISLRADIQVGQADVPYFYGKDLSFTADAQGLTPDLTQAHGTLRLKTGEGKIQDIYKLTDASPVTKVLFLSLNITGKVFNSLNVFGVLESIGSGISSVVAGKEKEEVAVKTQTVLGPDGEPLEIPVVETDKQVSGEMAYDKFDTEVNFVRGVATVKEGTFVSPMMSFRLDGTTDFNTQAVDFTVHAAPGRHEVDGMLPLTLKIGGTVDNPQGNMQVLGSVTSLVTQSVTSNVVSRQLGKGIKGVLGLFKKDNAAETTPQPEAANATPEPLPADSDTAN